MPTTKAVLLCLGMLLVGALLGIVGLLAYNHVRMQVALINAVNAHERDIDRIFQLAGHTRPSQTPASAPTNQSPAAPVQPPKTPGS